MAMFDVLIDDMARRFGLGASAGPLVREALAVIVGSQGGVGAFLENLKSTGLASQVSSWLGHADAAPLTAQETERALGPNVPAGIANRLGLAPAAVSTALGYAIPRLVGLLTPNGVVPTGIPAEATNFLSREGSIDGVAPKRVDVYETPDSKAPRPSRLPGLLWPLLGVLVLLGLGWYFWPMLNCKPFEAPVAHAPAASPAPVATASPAPPAPPAAPPGPAASTQGSAATPPQVATTVPASAPAPAAAPSLRFRRPPRRRLRRQLRLRPLPLRRPLRRRRCPRR